MRAYSKDLRERVIKAVEGGLSCRKAARKLDVGAATAIRWTQQWKTTGSVAPVVHKPSRSPLEAHAPFLLNLVEQQPDMTLEEIKAALFASLGVTSGRACSVAYSVFFKTDLPPREEPMDGANGRRDTKRGKQRRLDPKKLVFIDETGTATNMTRLRGRCLRGKRLVSYAPRGHWKMTTYVAALRCDRVTAPLVLDGPMNTQAFLAYIEQFVLPTLSPGDIVSMDNLSSHKSAAVRTLIESVGASLMYLPAYSPDLNPIEMLFAQLKAYLRKAKARSVEALWTTIGRFIETVTQQQCANYFAHDGGGHG